MLFIGFNKKTSDEDELVLLSLNEEDHLLPLMGPPEPVERRANTNTTIPQLSLPSSV